MAAVLLLPLGCGDGDGAAPSPDLLLLPTGFEDGSAAAARPGGSARITLLLTVLVALGDGALAGLSDTAGAGVDTGGTLIDAGATAGASAGASAGAGLCADEEAPEGWEAGAIPLLLLAALVDVVGLPVTVAPGGRAADVLLTRGWVGLEVTGLDRAGEGAVAGLGTGCRTKGLVTAAPAGETAAAEGVESGSLECRCKSNGRDWPQQQVVMPSRKKEGNSTIAGCPAGAYCMSFGVVTPRARRVPTCTLGPGGFNGLHTLASRVSGHVVVKKGISSTSMDAKGYPLEVHAWVCQHVTFVDVKPDADVAALKVQAHCPPPLLKMWH